MESRGCDAAQPGEGLAGRSDGEGHKAMRAVMNPAFAMDFITQQARNR